jgi:hypothetical protein
MSYVPGFSNDVFISYSHLDDRTVEGTGWVSDFHRRLQIEVDQELGTRVQIWRDPRIGPADAFARDLDRQLRGSAMLIAILSPGYLNSPWCEWELAGFAGPRRTGDLWVETKCRAIKIVKRPADADAHRVRVLSETGSLKFFDVDEASGRAHELKAGSDRFNTLLTDLAAEIAIVLRKMRRARSVWLGTAPDRLRDQRERVRRELDAHGYRAVTTDGEPQDQHRDAVRTAIGDSSLSILFWDRSDPTAADRASAASAAERDVAIDEGARQIVVVRGRPESASQPWYDLVTTDRASNAEWLIEPPMHTLLHTVLQMLATPFEPERREPAPPASRAASPAPDRGRAGRMVRVYLVCDRPDHPLLLPNRARNLRDHLLSLGFEVKVPLAEDSDAAEFSRDNRNKLRQCDGVLLYWGTARQSWFDERLGELVQARGWRRGRDFSAVAAYVADPQNPVKQNYETREVDELIKQFERFDLSDAKLLRFCERLGQPA